MAVRQYIGARYVPLYAGDWDATKNYEPLMIVTDANGNSFTSLKDVPAGTALTDRSFWIQTSSFSASVNALQRRMNAAEGDISTLQTALSNAVLAGRRFLMVGDSFGYGITGVSSPASDYGWLKYLNGKNQTMFKYNHAPSAGNIGFSSARSVQSVIEEMNLSKEERDKITDIVVLCGNNDTDLLDSVPGAIRSFMDYCTDNFINAKVRIGVIGTRLTRNEALISAYKTICNYGGEYMSDGENLLCNPAHLSSDTIHLSDTGYRETVDFIAQLVCSGKVEYKFTFTIPVTLADGLSVAGSGALMIGFTVSNNMVEYNVGRDPSATYVKLWDTNIISIPNNAQGYRSIPIGTIDKSLLPILKATDLSYNPMANIDAYVAGTFNFGGYIYVDGSTGVVNALIGASLTDLAETSGTVTLFIRNTGYNKPI